MVRNLPVPSSVRVLVCSRGADGVRVASAGYPNACAFVVFAAASVDIEGVRDERRRPEVFDDV